MNRYPLLKWSIHPQSEQETPPPRTEEQRFIIRVNGVDHVLQEEYRKYAFSPVSRKRIMLWVLQKGLCHWCGKETLLADHAGYLKATGRLAGNAATLDHLYSKLNPLREKRGRGPHEYVMACNTCNGMRSKRECTKDFKEEHERRARENQNAMACVEAQARPGGDEGT